MSQTMYVEYQKTEFSMEINSSKTIGNFVVRLPNKDGVADHIKKIFQDNNCSFELHSQGNVGYWVLVFDNSDDMLSKFLKGMSEFRY